MSNRSGDEVRDPIRIVVALIVIALGFWGWQVPEHRLAILIALMVATVAFAIATDL